MAPVHSSYYPPRARWYSCFYYLWQWLCRWLPLERLRLPGGFNLWQFLLGLIIPGYAFFVLRRQITGRIISGAYGALLLVAVIGLGSSVATLAYGFMVALHAVSVAIVLESWLQPAGFGRRLVLVLLATLVLAVLCYLPAQRWIQSQLIMPLRVGTQDLMLIPDDRTASLRPGVVRVFRFGGGIRVQGAYLGQGYVVAEIQGGPGDRIQFESGLYRINDRAHRARPLMPSTGEWVVPENHWFIWPDSSIRVQGALPALDPGQMDALLREMALVPSSRVVGRPLRWWFWRNLYVP
jgi:hypothetical protein